MRKNKDVADNSKFLYFEFDCNNSEESYEKIFMYLRFWYCLADSILLGGLFCYFGSNSKGEQIWRFNSTQIAIQILTLHHHPLRSHSPHLQSNKHVEQCFGEECLVLFSASHLKDLKLCLIALQIQVLHSHGMLYFLFGFVKNTWKAYFAETWK